MTLRTIFLSHAHADNAICDRYVEALRKLGFDVWYDTTNMEGGRDLSRAIEAQLAARTAFVVMLSANSTRSYWVELETSTYRTLVAKDRTRLILPVIIGQCDIPVLLQGLRWVDTLGLPFEAAAEQIALALGASPEAIRAANATVFPEEVPPPATSPQSPSSSGVDRAKQIPTTTLPLEPILPELHTKGFAARKSNGATFILPPLCSVPGGEFMMGSDPKIDPQTQANELPQHSESVGPFWIARFPVTVEEYRLFVDSDHKHPPNSYDQDWAKQLKHPSHPVVCITYESAEEYCKWLRSLTNQLWRLPSEEEWEKAAKFAKVDPVPRVYPWGSTFYADLCNTSASGNSSTLPVGSYPAGKSPSGAEDMAGNVLEWTTGFVQPYEEALDSSNEFHNQTKAKFHRALRGGSWYHGPVAARAAFRGNYEPSYCLFVTGFRLVLQE